MPQSSNTMSSQPLVPEESKGSDPQVSQRKEKDEKQAAKVLGSVSEDSPAQNTDYPLQGSTMRLKRGMLVVDARTISL